MFTVFVDADGCPVKQEIYRVAMRHKLSVRVVANSRIHVPQADWLEAIVVEGDHNAADDWIAARVGEGDIVITADVPLAARCLKEGARVIAPTGRPFTDESIGAALAQRELMSHLRAMGTMTGGPPPFEPRDRSRFLHSLDETIRSVLRTKRGG